MAAKKAGAKKAGKAAPRKPAGDLIISKSRVKSSVKDCNVSKDFYEALDGVVRRMIVLAEERALGNKRKTLRPWDL